MSELTHSLSLRRFAASLVVLACAASAGAHAGLVPEHLRTEPRLGVAFVVAVLILLSTGTAVAARPADHRIAGAAALLFAGLIVAYVATRTMGIPLLSPDPEAVDAVGVATNLVEVLGFACALMLTQPSRRHPGRAVSQEVTS